MRKVILTTVVLSLGVVLATEAQAFPWQWRTGYRDAPASAGAAVPTAPAMAEGGGVRSFSYQPSTAPATVPGEYRAFTYQPAPTYNYAPAYRPMRDGGHAYQNAINKSLGRVN